MTRYVSEVEPPHDIDNEPIPHNHNAKRESIEILKDGLGYMQEDDSVSKVKLIDSTLGELGKILEMKPTEIALTEVFSGKEHPEVVEAPPVIQDEKLEIEEE